ncbi:hypothetical protein CP02DC21_1611B, partial [Chlamydia psittaci 02DC21]
CLIRFDPVSSGQTRF